ncbi:hypothetical protein CMI41_02395, partial [Candidatus Pacearchaeota archaeon]|nr:hypothetical protein [Candidatus Pacearchaeota archaeon]
MDLAMGEFLAKARVYVKNPSEAPEGANVQRGPRGGYYFEEGGKKAPAEEEAPEGAPAAEPAPAAGVPNQGPSTDPATGQPDMLMEPEEWESRSGVDGQILNLLENNEGIPEEGTPDRAALNTMVARMAELTGDDPYEIAQEYASDAGVWAREGEPKDVYEYEDQPYTTPEEQRAIDRDIDMDSSDEELNERYAATGQAIIPSDAPIQDVVDIVNNLAGMESNQMKIQGDVSLDPDIYEIKLGRTTLEVDSSDYTDMTELMEDLSGLLRYETGATLDNTGWEETGPGEMNLEYVLNTEGEEPSPEYPDDPDSPEGKMQIREDTARREDWEREQAKKPSTEGEVDVDEYGEKPGQYPGGLHEEEWNALSNEDQ